MSDRAARQVAIVDYGMGNLFSVQKACEQVGLHASITNSKHEILAASAVILPGVGAFGVAMETLTKLDLIEPLRDVAASQTLLIGICLGMQLLMTESHEFGKHEGLGIIEGEVVRLQNPVQRSHGLKIPQVGWNQIHSIDRSSRNERLATSVSSWKGTLLDGIHDGEFMYFVHSFYCRPVDSSVVLSTTRFGALEFCSTFRRGHTIGFQFHPERSGPEGLRLYRNLSTLIS